MSGPFVSEHLLLKYPLEDHVWTMANQYCSVRVKGSVAFLWRLDMLTLVVSATAVPIGFGFFVFAGSKSYLRAPTLMKAA